MPVGTSSLSIKALPLEVIHKERNTTFSQMLSPSSILPTTSLFKLHISTNSNTKLKYEINVQQSNNLMQRSGLFYDLSTQYNHYASQTSLEDHLANSNGFANSPSLEDLAQEANGLPMLCIELPNIPIGIIEDLLQWLFNNTEIKADDILASTLASNIQSTSDFFSLLNFITLLDLFEPYCSVIDEILVWYYFGLNEKERSNEILKNESFVEGVIPARFVKRLAESVNEFEEKFILSSFFRGKVPTEETFSERFVADPRVVNKGRESEFEEIFLNDDNVTKAHKRASKLSPLDLAEPPTPLGSAYFCINPNIPFSPTFQRLLSHTPKITKFTFSTSPSSDIFEDVPLTAGLSVPPNTPNSSVHPFVPPTNAPNPSFRSVVLTNTPNSSVHIVAPPNTPNSPFNNIAPPNSPATPSFFTPIVPPNTPNALISPTTTTSYSAIKINGLLSPTLISISPSSTPITAPPNTPTSPFIFQSNNNYNYNNVNCGNKNFSRNSREKNVTINSVLANSLNNLYKSY
ncbi:8121_t:CDS:1 [Funneliformis mosseae]|uniref:8121_t:CDS:1 n=1 Tax=Funneliformis mosseae TaxID=27381 RepID=A0A9N9BGB9_FUNMO|nr:8121_t:CDS:1 [Funneliformis mosseae]